jgi:hypothetical protein
MERKSGKKEDKLSFLFNLKVKKEEEVIKRSYKKKTKILKSTQKKKEDKIGLVVTESKNFGLGYPAGLNILGFGCPTGSKSYWIFLEQDPSLIGPAANRTQS